MAAVLALFVSGSVFGAPTLSVIPSSVADNALGSITLQIAGLQTGEAVHVGKFLDVNGNGVPDAGDLLIQAFQLIDGQVTVIGGITNYNIPYDADANPGSVSAQLNLKTSGVEQQFASKYIFMVISPTARFAPVTAPFQITNASRGQSISGNVQNGGSAVPNALVLLFAPSGDGMSPLGGVVADNAGHYSMQAVPGNYMLVAFRSNYVANMSGGPNVNLTAGVNATANMTLVPATCSVSGRISASGDSEFGLPGLLIPCETESGGIAIGFTDTDGGFSVPVTAGQWKIHPDSGNLRLLGFSVPNNSLRVDTSTGSVSGITIGLPMAQALFYGHVRDEQNQPLSGVSIYGDESSGMYENDAITDENGRYVMAVSSGNWYLSVDSQTALATSYVYSQMSGYSPVTSGQAIQQHFTGKVADLHITSTVKDNGNAAVTGVGVYVYATINNVTYNDYTETDDSGHYSLAVPAGTWHVGLSCDGDNGLGARGYSCVGEQTVVISNGDGSANFVVSSCAPLAVTTSSLPNAEVGAYYDIQLQADGCQSPFHWSMAPGSAGLPNGLYLDDNGYLSGECQNSGDYTFTVRVTDSAQNTADRQLSISVHGNPLQIDTHQLPNATIDTEYSEVLYSTGGQRPYVWSLAPGSAPLPANITLSASGQIYGTPTNAGTYYFYVRVTDDDSNHVDQMLSLTVDYPALAIDNSTLPDATVGVPYQGQLAASGGQPPYYWSLALGSANLPAGLNLGTNGIVSGTPATNGSFFFMVSVRDASYVSVSRTIGIQIEANQTRVTLSAPARSGTSKFQFMVNGNAGRLYTLQTTTDFKEWVPVMSTNAPANSFLIQLDRSTNRATFYRVKAGM